MADVNRKEYVRSLYNKFRKDIVKMILFSSSESLTRIYVAGMTKKIDESSKPETVLDEKLLPVFQMIMEPIIKILGMMLNA